MRLAVIVATLPILWCGSLPSAKAQSPGTGGPPPPGWREAISTANDLFFAGKHAEMVALFESWVAKYPKFPEAYFRLSASLELLGRDQLAGGAPDRVARSRPHFERAIKYARQSMELPGGAEMATMELLIELNGVRGLNQPDEYERLVFEAVRRFPAEAGGHAYLIALRVRQNASFDEALGNARTALPKSADALVDLASNLFGFRYERNPIHVETFLRLALDLTNEALIINPQHEDARLLKRIIDEENRERARKPGAGAAA